MSMFHDAFLPTTAGLHGGDHDAVAAAAVKNSKLRLRKSKSHASFLSPISRLAKGPKTILESFLPQWPYTDTGAVLKNKSDEDRKQVLYVKLREATSYTEWRTAACELDTLEGNDAWKAEEASAEYNYKLVKDRSKQFEDARISCDVDRMLFLIRTTLTRGLGGMGDIRLYKHSHVGTKASIENYIESAQSTIQALLDVSAKQKSFTNTDSRDLLDKMLQTRQSFGRSALLLSGGGTFGMNHIGVVKCLWEAKLLPRIISGASAGSIIAGVLGTKIDSEVPGVLAEFCYGDLAVFEAEGDGLLNRAERLLKSGAIFEITHLKRVIRDLLGDITFQEAYNRTRRILNITVSSEGRFDLPRLLNYVTAPNVIIWSAITASCSVPLIFPAGPLLAKDPKSGNHVPWNPSPQRWIDGSVDNDLPMTRLAEMFNVNHFIVSQVNPHVVPFLRKEEDRLANLAQESTSAFAAGPSWLNSMANLAKDEALHRLHVLAEMGIFPDYCTKIRSILSQTYSGDITIFPEIPYSHFPKVLSNPTTEYMLQAMLGGERATWPKLSRIRNHCAIELALDNAVRELRARVAFSPSQIDLRQALHGYVRPASSGTDQARRSGFAQANRKIPSMIHQKSSPATMEADTEEDAQPVIPRMRTPTPSKYRGKACPRPSNIDATVMSPLFVKISTSDALSTSSDEDETSDSYDAASLSSPDSPPSPSPEHPHSARRLFPSASQPATPITASRSFGMLSMAAYPEAARRPSGAEFTQGRTVAPPQIASTRELHPPMSIPEIQYKRLFHPRQDVLASSTPLITDSPILPAAAATSAALTTAAALHAQGNSPTRAHSRHPSGGDLTPTTPGSSIPPQLDISGTRGMMLRRKRSELSLPQTTKADQEADEFWSSSK